MCWHKLQKQIKSFRLDYILGVEQGVVCENYDVYNDMLNRMKNHMWGVICKKSETATEHIDFTVHMDDDEDHIYRRLLREKRCGTVEKTDNNTCRFSANVYDTTEMVPWIRTFICRITELHMSNKKVEEKFKRDLEHMYRMYGIGGGDDAVQ